MEWFSRFVSRFYARFFLGALYVFITVFFIGEMHPFSRFPMFSYLTDTIRLYYLADENGHPITTNDEIRIKNDEVQDLIESSLRQNDANWEDDNAMKAAGEEAMDNIVQDFLTSDFAYKELAIVKVNIILMNDSITYDTLVLSKRSFTAADH